ncbi:MAG: hypothetical protein EZS28_010261 [Streblomastix strix]|uniref:Uncharacterized protein n=1 Tax=Streblomastix strix TaxID=222440 RepID=A0A5J4WI06_9EUKA|nr:MAG: hypothetical protein EZS28_010261 [Streblomastix strix]
MQILGSCELISEEDYCDMFEVKKEFVVLEVDEDDYEEEEDGQSNIDNEDYQFCNQFDVYENVEFWF